VATVGKESALGLPASHSLRPGQWSIGVKLAVMVLIGQLSMAVVISLPMFSTADALFTRQAQTELGNQNQVLADQIDNLTAKASSDLLLARQNLAFNQYYLASDAATRQAALEGIQELILYLTRRFTIDEICVIDDGGAERARCVRGILASIRELSKDESRNPFFTPTLALSDGEVYRSPVPYVSPDTHRWVVAHATPLVLPDGTKVGILHFEIPLVWFAARLDANTLAGSTSFLMTKDGLLLVHPRLDDFRQAAGIDTSHPDQAAFPPAATLGSSDYRLLLEQMQVGQAGRGTYRDGPETYEVVYQPVFGGQWIVATELPRSAITRQGTDLLRQTFLVALPLLALALAFMLWYATRLVRPLQVTTRALRTAAKGGANPLPVTSHDEFGELALAFNQMTAELYASHQQVSERTQALQASHTQLEQAYQLLQDNQAKLLIAEKMASLGRLTAGIAHEMNTPLAAVRASLSTLGNLVQEYMASIGDPEVTASDHQEIGREMLLVLGLGDKAAERAAGFVRGIRVQTRAEAPGDRRRFNAVPAIEEALLLLSHTLRDQGCTVNFEPSANAIELYGSPGRLGQVVTNLVTNAIDALRDQEGGSIELHLSRNATGVKLVVRDHGCGIPAENLTKIFDPLFTTKPFGEGTGLGLAIVHDIVVGEFGGTINLVSQPGQGSAFTVHFPDQHEDQDAAQSQN
jgi:signal transduction histidine kinase